MAANIARFNLALTISCNRSGLMIRANLYLYQANNKKTREGERENEEEKQCILGTRHVFNGRTGKGVNSLSCRGVGSSAVRKVLGRDHLLSRDWISPRLGQRLGLIKISLWVGGDSYRRRLASPHHASSPSLFESGHNDRRMVWGKYAGLPLLVF